MLFCRGVIFFENKAFGLEPVPQSTTNDHLLYLLEDVQTEPITCGVVTEATSVPSHEPFEPGQSLTSLLRVKCSFVTSTYICSVKRLCNMKIIGVFVALTEKTQFTTDQLCGVGAGCG